MEVALLVPWAPGDPHREASWTALKARHLAHGRTVIEGRCDGPWCKATAVADALTRTDADLLVIHDADVWCDGLDHAIQQIDALRRWAVPHRLVYRLAEGQHDPTTDPARLDEKNPYLGYAGGGIVVIDRAAYEACPLDPRFIGWGQEDSSLAHALTTLIGAPWRGDEPLFHWWHPPQPRRSRSIGSHASDQLSKRYQRAAGVLPGRRLPANRIEMEALVEEARTWQASTTSASTATASATS